MVKHVANATCSFAIGGPGLRSALADNAAITVGNSYTANVAFHRRALELAIRPLAEPPSSLASDTMTVSDAASGLTFTVSVYPGYHKSMIEVSVAWGVKAWKPDFIATLMG